jgi:hypothetical protein
MTIEPVGQVRHDLLIIKAWHAFHEPGHINIP